MGDICIIHYNEAQPRSLEKKRIKNMHFHFLEGLGGLQCSITKNQRVWIEMFPHLRCYCQIIKRHNNEGGSFSRLNSQTSLHTLSPSIVSSWSKLLPFNWLKYRGSWNARNTEVKFDSSLLPPAPLVYNSSSNSAFYFLYIVWIHQCFSMSTSNITDKFTIFYLEMVKENSLVF